MNSLEQTYEYFVSYSFIQAAGMTLLITVMAVLLGIIIGLIIAIMQESKIGVLGVIVGLRR